MAVGIGSGDIFQTIRCTSSMLQRQETFTNFDFIKAWTMAGNIDYPYPELQNVPLTAAPVIPVVPATPGDLNDDGSITIDDVMEACKILARISAGQKPSDNEIARGDLDRSGTISINDVIEICKLLARKAQ